MPIHRPGKTRFWILTAGILLAVAIVSATRKPSLPAQIAAADSLDARRTLATTYVQNSIVGRIASPGFAVAVSIDGEIVWSRGFGLADRERALPVTPETQFRIGSVSKILTTAGVARLYDAGKLDLDADVRTLLPEFPDKSASITVRLLSAHMGGIRHYAPDEPERIATSGKHFDDIASALNLFKNDPLVAPPGTRWEYSSYGWTLISAVLERGSGMEFLEFMEQEVAAPLKMLRTTADDVRIAVPDRAQGYVGHGEEIEVGPVFDKSFVWAAGGFLSTPEDLVRLGQAFMTIKDDADDRPGRFLEPATRAMILERQRTTSGMQVPFGIGWFIDRTEGDMPVAYHGGITSGGHAMLLIRPAEGVAVAFAGNHESGIEETQANVIASIFAGTPNDVGLQTAQANASRKKTARRELRALFGELMTGLAERDLEKVMRWVSTDFTSRTWPTREAFREGLRQAFVEGPMGLDDSAANARFSGYEVGSITILMQVRAEGGPLNKQMTELRFRLEESGWRLLAWDAEAP